MNNKAQVRAAFLSGGEPAARKKGEAIGVKASTLDTYIKRFLAGKELGNEPRVSKPKAELRPLRFADGVAAGVAVYDVANPREYGTVKEFGPEQCLVKWPDRTTAACTSWLKAVPENKKDRERAMNEALASLASTRAAKVRVWIEDQKREPDDEAIWSHIRNRWPSLNREDREAIFHQT